MRTPARSPTSKKRRASPLRHSTSKNFARMSGSRQNGFSSSLAAMWFGTTSRITPRPGLAELRGTPPRRRARPRAGSDRRRRSRGSSRARACIDGDEVEVADAELLEVRHELARRVRSRGGGGAGAGRCSGSRSCLRAPGRDGQFAQALRELGRQLPGSRLPAPVAVWLCPECSGAPRSRARGCPARGQVPAGPGVSASRISCPVRLLLARCRRPRALARPCALGPRGVLPPADRGVVVVGARVDDAVGLVAAGRCGFFMPSAKAKWSTTCPGRPRSSRSRSTGGVIVPRSSAISGSSSSSPRDGVKSSLAGAAPPVARRGRSCGARRPPSRRRSRGSGRRGSRRRARTSAGSARSTSGSRCGAAVSQS